MLQYVKLQNFKCFEALELGCAPLTLLCGLNGMGKSSVIQALLALRQSIEVTRQNIPGELFPNGDLVKLGTGKDVLFEDAQEHAVGIEIQDTEFPGPYVLKFDYLADSERLVKASGNGTGEISGGDKFTFSPFTCHEFLYIAAERTGPRPLYPHSQTTAWRGNFGSHSEYALSHWVSRAPGSNALKADDPRCDGQAVHTLEAVLNHWLGTISPGASFPEPDIIKGADAILAHFKFEKLGDAQTRFRATNVGFGLSYTLPVIISLLSPPNSLCLIENPEAHLHPKGQTSLASLAVRASKAGLQLIVETHSDHFLDGVRVAVREDLISPEDVAIHYFERKGNKTVVTSPRLDSDGRLSSWPSGFFDQHEENLAKLLAPRQ